MHVVFNTPAQNVSDAQIQSQIDVLNADYRRLNADSALVPAEFTPVKADAKIQFRLAVRDPNCNSTNGITRRATTVTQFSDNDAVKASATGGEDPWPADKYLNIWVANLGSLLLGYGTYPGTPAAVDGVVINYTAFGTIGTAAVPFDKGRTATHEIGHYFNLFHTFQGGCSGGTLASCAIAGDRVCDTPSEIGSAFGCPGVVNTCLDTPIDHNDQTMNYMDYTDDACMYMFSAGQSERMDAAIYGPRASLLGSDALIPPPPVGTADLFSRDTPDDPVDEPNVTSTAFYMSDDIWVRHMSDGITN